MAIPPRRAALVALGVAAVAGLLGFGLLRYQRRAPPLETVVASPQVQQLSAANTGFGFRLLGKLLKDRPESNVFYSPHSVSSALSLLRNGAGGESERQIATTLGLSPLPLEEANAASALLRRSLVGADPKIELSVANALWVHHELRFANDFKDRGKRFYDAETQALDFHAASSERVINGWALEHTKGRIDRVISAKELEASKAVLTNAVYFYARWQEPFSPRDTREQPFFVSEGRSKSVPLMSQTGHFSYLETEQFQLARLPYGEGRLSFYVLLPKAGIDLPLVLSHIDEKSWSTWMSSTRTAYLALSLPRFEAQFEAELKEPLTSLGMTSVFDGRADFGPMGLGPVAIGAVRHKAFLKVDEVGTEAAAVTVVTMVPISLPPRPKEMRVDRPFLFAVRDDATGTLLFLGVIRDPSAKDPAGEQTGLSEASGTP